jgi:hypothetical protein
VKTKTKILSIATIVLLILLPPIVYAQEPTPEPVNSNVVTVIAFIGLFFGTVMAVFLPYIRKVWQGTVDASDWNNKYLLVAFAGIILSLVTTFQIAPQLLILEVPAESAIQGIFGLFIVNFAVGFGETGVLKEVIEFGKSSTVETKSPP